MTTKKYTTIVWDFNGTILDDVDESVATINELLRKRNLNLLSKDTYKSIFGFPVKAYYHDIGFDFNNETWENVAAEFMAAYHARENNFVLFEGVIETLSYFKATGHQQYILSAMKTNSITKILTSFKISQFFDGVYGLDHHYADSKVELGKLFKKEEDISPTQCLMIGDTSHDAEVANALNIDSYLISNGHESYERLTNTGKPVLKDIKALRNKF